MPERYAVIGDPIGHSLSPAMHAAAFGSAGMHAVYEAHRVPPAALSTHVASLRGGYRGFNITVPHKQTVRRCLDELDGQAIALRAVNTVTVDGGRLTGHNTDPAGFREALAVAGVDPVGAGVVLFGAGGAARAVLHALSGRAATITVVNRDEGRAREMAADRARVMGRCDSRLRDLLRRADLIVNATSLGMTPQEDLNPLPDDTLLAPHTVLYDLVYGHLTPFLKTGQACGCRTIDGLEMLVRQGAASFRLWTGIDPDTDAMRGACLAALRERACSVS